MHAYLFYENPKLKQRSNLISFEMTGGSSYLPHFFLDNLDNVTSGMKNNDDSSVNDFLLLGFSILGKKPTLLFVIFSLTYGTILTFNITIMSVILLDRALHCPMYFLLFALSASETCSTFVTIPKLLFILLTGGQSISFVGCAMQMFCFLSLSANNCFLLVAMSYDRYAAICYPLQYQVLMEKKVCIKLVAASCLAGCYISLVICILIFRLPFCGPKEIQHFFCDISPVLNLTCTDTYLTHLAVVLLCAVVLLGTVLLISLSYAYIISAILRISSSLGRKKMFSTCTSHLTVVITHFSCASFVYLRPKAVSSLGQDTWLSTVFVFITPLLNPLIYTLRNKDVKLSIQKLLRSSFCPQTL